MKCAQSKYFILKCVMSGKFQISPGCILNTPVKDVAEVFCARGAKLTAGHTKTSRNLIYTYVICVYNKHITRSPLLVRQLWSKKKIAQGETPPIETNLPISKHLSLKVYAG